MTLYDEHLVYDNGIQHRRVSQMHAQDYRPEYRETRVVESESSDKTYLLGEIRVLDVPFEDSDASEDTLLLWVCSCDDYYFNQSAGLEDGSLQPSEAGECKHIRGSVKSERAMADDAQVSLEGVASDD